MFIRFVRPRRLAGTSAREGFFCSAYELRRNRFLDDVTSERLDEALSWFSTNLTIPKKFSRSRSKGRDNAEFTQGLSWFKEDATPVITRAFDLIALLKEHDCQTEIIRTDRVGYILYEDDDQVVAEPFADTPV
ncbi:hypothetical protein HOY34_13890 [Xinfangfangia sp. D13-10-4-6]|uniref:hypothetical protein n=1 Tax=Pseudogemmobacter hezensis TaxID=2737662 RepID=UPI00155391D4|nr:hypothetical protein [Pseudogemmobacter hezensis]NPD16286.1 hypothetical protein [Pseudogemmobacter hezensis]